MIARSTTQHLFASVAGEEWTVLLAHPANRTPFEYSQVTVPESNIDSLPEVVPAVEEKVFSRVMRRECYGRQRPWRFFLLNVARMFEQPGSLEQGLIFAFEL